MVAERTAIEDCKEPFYFLRWFLSCSCRKKYSSQAFGRDSRGGEKSPCVCPCSGEELLGAGGALSALFPVVFSSLFPLDDGASAAESAVFIKFQMPNASIFQKILLFSKNSYKLHEKDRRF